MVMTTNMYYSIKSLLDDLMALCKTAVPVPEPETECREDIQVHAAVHAALPLRQPYLEIVGRARST